MLVIKSFRKPIVIIMIMLPVCELCIAFGYNLFLFLAAIFSLFLPWVPPWISTFHSSSKHLWWYKVCTPVFNKVAWIRPHPLMFWYILSHRELEVIIISDCWPGTNASRLLLFMKSWTQGFSKINEQIITKTHYNMYHYRISMSSYRESVSVG